MSWCEKICVENFLKKLPYRKITNFFPQWEFSKRSYKYQRMKKGSGGNLQTWLRFEDQVYVTNNNIILLQIFMCCEVLCYFQQKLPSEALPLSPRVILGLIPTFGIKFSHTPRRSFRRVLRQSAKEIGIAEYQTNCRKN